MEKQQSNNSQQRANNRQQIENNASQGLSDCPEVNVTSFNFKENLTREVKYIVGVVMFLAGVVTPFIVIQQDVALIKQNHYMHIEQANKAIELNALEIKRLSEEQGKLMQIIIKNQTNIENIQKDR